MWSDWWIYLVVIILFIVIGLIAIWTLKREGKLCKKWGWAGLGTLFLFIWVLFITYFSIAIVRGLNARQEQTTIGC